MRTIGAFACLLLFPLCGWLLESRPLSKTQSLESPLRPDPPALERASAIFRTGKYDEAAQAYSSGYRAATQRGERDLAARFLWGIGNCHFAKRQYRQAIESFLSARTMSELSGNQGSVNSLNGSPEFVNDFETPA